MLNNYLKIALRNLHKRAGYTLINVGGLGLGLACCFLIVLFIQHEISFDRFHRQADDIYRLTRTYEGDDEIKANTAAGYKPLLEDVVPEIAHIIRTEDFRNPYLQRADGSLQRTGGLWLVDPAFFEVFSFPLLRGDPATALQDKYAMVLTESTAAAFFGEENPVGKSLRWSGRFDMTVTGVVEDPPDNSLFRFKALASFPLVTEFQGPDELDGFTNYNYETYMLLKPGASKQAAEQKIREVSRTHFGEESTFIPILQPLANIHFNTSLVFDNGTSRDVRYLYIFGVVGLLILLIACVNFTNLATARAAQRAKEIGIRKTVGAQRVQLVGQFLGESVLLSVVAIVLAIVLAWLALPTFNEAVGSTAPLDLSQPGTIGLLIGIGLLAGLLAGGYPALYLAAFSPAKVLKGDVKRGSGAPLLRQGLIVFQFAISVFLIVATLGVYNQLDFMRSQDLGFSKEHVVFVSPPSELRGSYDAFKQQLLDDSRITSVALTGGLPGRTGTNRGYNWPGQGEEEEGSSFWSLFADPHYLETLGMELLAGRSFSFDVPTDTQDTYILNEAALAKIGWTPEEAVGHPFRAWDRPMGTVIGVVKDFHFQSLHQEIQPLVMNYKPQWMGGMAMRLAPGDVPGALEHLQATWSTFAPGFPMEYRFLDDDFDRLYHAEERLMQLFTFFAAIAIFIACLGLFGLAAYVAQQRTKEIGVRKVLGASVPNLVGLLSKDFVVLVGIAFILATPAAYLAMQRWLADFAYRIDLPWLIFVMAGLTALLIALATVSYQAYRAALCDPVKSLRYE